MRAGGEDGFIATVNALLNGVGPRGGDPNFAKAINAAQKKLAVRWILIIRIIEKLLVGP